MTDAVRPSELDPRVAARLKRDSAGLMAAIAQQYDTGEVLMLGWMDDEALHRTLTTGRCTYWSRSRQEYWVKGETSGHLQLVKSVALDCDGDAILVRVDQVGAACHTGDRTCFDADVLDAAVGERPDAVPAGGGTDAVPAGGGTDAVPAGGGMDAVPAGGGKSQGG
jgi:phosphoribosyl-AMP cyclohydrolase